MASIPLRNAALRLRLIGVCAAGVALLAACGGSGGSSRSAGAVTGSTAGATAVAAAPAAGDGGASSGSAAAHAESIDVCALLTSDDATAVARQRGLGGDGSATATFHLTTTEVPSTDPRTAAHGCKFSISALDSDGSPEASATFQILVSPATDFASYGTDAHKVPGLGDEAYDDGSSTFVRVGNVMLETTENESSDDFVTAVYRKMIPRIH